MANISVFPPNLPKTLPLLRRKIENSLITKSTSALNVQTFSNGGSKKQIPYLELTSVICHWLSTPSLHRSIININNTYTLPFVTTMDALNTEIRKRYTRISAGNLCNGTAWLQILADTFTLWNPRMSIYKNSSEVVFLHLLHHNDEYGWKGTAKNDRKSTVWLVSCGEIERILRNDLSTHATLPLLLTSSNEYKDVGVSGLWEIYKAESQELSKGKVFLINGIQYFVVALMSNLLGDIPARKEIFGLSSSANLQMPCHSCTIKLSDMKNTIITNTRSRDNEELIRFIANSSKEPGKDASSITTSMNTTGFNFYSLIWTFPGQPKFNSIMIDIMHMYYLGILRDAFEQLSKMVLSSRIEGKGWPALSNLYKGYCKVNNIQTYYNFTNFNTWKGLKAYGIKKFCAVSPFLLIQMKVVAPKTVNESDAAYRKRQEFKLWNCLCTTASILAQHTIDRSDLASLDSLVNYSIQHLLEKAGRHLTLNFHLQIHLIKHIIEHGVPREYWCFPHETMIGKIKGMYRHTNNKNTHTSLLKRYITNVNLHSISSLMSKNTEEISLTDITLEEFSCHLDCTVEELPPWINAVKLLEEKVYVCNFVEIQQSFVIQIEKGQSIIFGEVNSFYEINGDRYLSYEKLHKKHECTEYNPKSIVIYGFTSDKLVELAAFEEVIARWLYLPVDGESGNNIRNGDRYLVETV